MSDDRDPDSDWREGFRGGFGNSGQLSEAAYQRGRAYGPEAGNCESSGGPARGYPPGWSTGPASEAAWTSRAHGSRGTAGGVAGRDSDWTTRGEGPYSGVGPLRYQRSDERVHEDVCDRLTEHGGIDASSIEVTCEAGEITLEGTVPDHRSKRLAEEVAESARGVSAVHNQLRVSGASEDGRAFKLMK